MALSFAVLGWPPDGPTLSLDYRRFSYAGKFVTAATGKAVARDPTDVPPPLPDDDLPPPPETGEEGVVAAVAFNADRTDPDVLWLRYITVRADRRGEGIGPRLAAFVAERAGRDAESRGEAAADEQVDDDGGDDRDDDSGGDRDDDGGDDRTGAGYDLVRIAVNNPFAYEAMYRAGFAFAGRETGLAELVLARPAGPVGDWAERRDADAYRDGLDRFRERDLSTAEADFLDRNAGGNPPAAMAAPDGAEAGDSGERTGASENAGS